MFRCHYLFLLNHLLATTLNRYVWKTQIDSPVYSVMSNGKVANLDITNFRQMLYINLQPQVASCAYFKASIG